MGLCKELLKTELEGEKGGGVCCDRLLQNSGYNIKCYWLEALWFFMIHPQRMRGVWGGGLLGKRGVGVAGFLHISGIKI